MSLPDLLLKDSLFRSPTTGSTSRLQLNKAKLAGPLNNPLLEDNEGAHRNAEEGAATVSPPAGTHASDESSSPSEGQRAQTPLAATTDGASLGPSEIQTEETSQPGERRLVIPEALRTRLESLYNASQLAALEDSLKVEGVTLIQGPPGTGKTSTIVGVVSVILHAQLEGQNESYSHSPVSDTSMSMGKQTTRRRPLLSFCATGAFVGSFSFSCRLSNAQQRKQATNREQRFKLKQVRGLSGVLGWSVSIGFEYLLCPTSLFLLVRIIGLYLWDDVPLITFVTTSAKTGYSQTMRCCVSQRTTLPGWTQTSSR